MPTEADSNGQYIGWHRKKDTHFRVTGKYFCKIWSYSRINWIAREIEKILGIEDCVYTNFDLKDSLCVDFVASVTNYLKCKIFNTKLKYYRACFTLWFVKKVDSICQNLCDLLMIRYLFFISFTHIILDHPVGLRDAVLRRGFCRDLGSHRMSAKQIRPTESYSASEWNKFAVVAVVVRPAVAIRPRF